MGFGSGFTNPTPAVLTYLAETILYVNSGSGNDSGAGTISDPLQSLEEALKNVYARRLNGDDTHCNILLSGAVGDYDATSAIVYYWPGKYNNSLGHLSIFGWDGAETDPDTDAPSYLYTGSATLWANPSETVVTFDGHDSGSLLRLYTDSGYSTPVDLGAPGVEGPLAKGWQLVQNAPGRGRPIAHVVDHVGNTNTIRIAGPDTINTWDGGPDANGGTPWDTSGRGSSGLKIIKYGAKIDFTELQTAADVNASAFGMGVFKQRFWFLELTSSNLATYPNSARGVAGGRVTPNQCHIYYELNSGFGGICNYYESYIGSNDGFQLGTNGGQSYLVSCVFDGQWRAGETIGFKSRVFAMGYTIFQNYSSSTNGISMGGDCDLWSNVNPEYCVFHITGSAGIGAGTGYGKHLGTPIRIIGRVNGATDYALRLVTGSQWSWNSGNAVVQQDGTTEALVSVTNGESSGSADIRNGTYIYGYSSSSGIQNDFATDYSASFYSLIGDAS